MKKTLLSLLCLMLSGATTAWADSGLYLFGMEVPSTSNWSYDAYNNLNGAILNGTVSYDAATKTVTFDYIQAVVSDDTRILYNKNVPGLKIVFNSWGTLQSNYCVFRLDCNTEIQGPNSDDDLVILDARGNNSQCIYCPNETNLTIKDFGKLKMTSKYRAMHTKGTWVNVYNSNIYAQGDDCAVQNDMGNYDEFRGNLRLHNCILRDSWAMLMGSIGEGCTDYHAGGPYVFHVHTSKAKSAMIIREEDYIGVRLKGIALTKGWSVNEDTSNPSYGIEDYYTYDESTKTLTLKKDFRAKTGYGDDKKGNLADWVGISVNTPITINGDGHYVYGQRGLSCNDDATLNNIIIAGTEDGIYITGSKLTLKDDITVGGVESAIEIYKDSNGNSKGTVTFNPSFGKTIMLVPCTDKFKEATSFDDRPIDGYGAKLESCIITTPEGAEMRSGGPIMLNGKLVKTKVVITGINTYDLWVGETQVTSVNASDILGDGGHFKYDASTNTLTLTNATLENTHTFGGIDNKIDDLNINFVGANTINVNDPILSNKSINLIGNGSLKATSSLHHCIILNSQTPTTCTINGPQLDLTAPEEAIYDNNYTTLNVQGSSSRLALHPGEGYRAMKLSALNIGDGLHISEPAGGYFSFSLRGITMDGKNAYKGDVVIENEQNRKLGFSINGQEMTTNNINNVPGVKSGSAYVSLNSDGEPTLVLNNATLDWNDANAALDSGTKLTIRVQGHCVINAPDHTGLSLSGSTTIEGGGRLQINSKWAAIETWDNTRFALQDETTLIAHSSNYYGFVDSGMDYYQTWFIIEDGGLFAAFGAGECNPISMNSDRLVHFDSNIDLRYPVDGQLWNGYVYGADGNEVKNDWAVIGLDTQATDELIEELIYFPRRELGFSINGKEMTGLDVNDVPGVTSGNAYIDASEASTSTLVLDNATLDWNDAGAALNLHMGRNLTIRVLGDCQVNATDHTGFSLSGNAIIEGGGTLRINSKVEAIETFDNARLTIRGNTKVIAHSSDYYGYGDSGKEDGAYCSIEDGAVFAAFGAEPWNPFSFGYRSAHLGNGIDVRYPVGGYLSGMYVYYANESEVINDWVVFGPDNEATNELIEELVNNNHKLGFAINGKEMTTADMNNVPGLVSGNAYIETSETGAPTLVLEGATLEWNDANYGLYNYNVGQNSLTIRVQGDCTIKVPDAVALELDVATLTTIVGGGTLNINSGLYPIEIWNTSTLIIQDNTSVIAKSKTEYNALWNHKDANFEIRDGGIFAAYSMYEPIYLDPNSSFILGEGTALCHPVDAYIGSKNIIYYADGTEVMNDWIVFGPDTQATQDLITGVKDVNVNANVDLNNSWFDLQGRKVTNPRKGIYIKDGKKILIK